MNKGCCSILIISISQLKLLILCASITYNQLHAMKPHERNRILLKQALIRIENSKPIVQASRPSPQPTRIPLRKFPIRYDPYLYYFNGNPFLNLSIDLIDRERDL